MNKLSPKNLGSSGEEIAERFLKNKGYKIIDKNFKRKWGEIDIVAKKKRIIVFCEIKTIIKNRCFYPEDQITGKKKKQLLKMAQIYLGSKNLPLDTAHQIDIVAIEVLPEKNIIRHHKNAVADAY